MRLAAFEGIPNTSIVEEDMELGFLVKEFLSGGLDAPEICRVKRNEINSPLDIGTVALILLIAFWVFSLERAIM